MNITDEIRNMFLPITERWARFELMHSDPLRRLNRELREFGLTALQVRLVFSLVFFLCSLFGLYLEGMVFVNDIAAIFCLVALLLSVVAVLVLLGAAASELFIPDLDASVGLVYENMGNRRGWLMFVYVSILAVPIFWAGLGAVLSSASGYICLCFLSFKEPDLDDRPNPVRVALGLEDRLPRL